MITVAVLVCDDEMCPAAEILIVRENCVAKFFLWYVEPGTLSTDTNCNAT